RRYPLIFNPRAHSQKGEKVLRFLMTHANHFAVYATNHAGEARELAARFAAQGEAVVIAAGGDGTLNEVVGGLAGSSTVLGILPAGTVNVFAREMGIPCHSLDRAFAIIERGCVREVDLFAANGAPFVQMAGVGFDAAVIEETTWIVLDSLRGLACGGIDRLASTSYFQTEALTVRADCEVPVQVDGEWLGRFAEVRFKETAHHLRVLAPECPLTGSFADNLKSLLPWPQRRPELQTTRSR
ncbi:MAG: diacylglycerol kinase family protein, partial [Verrucomicrobia bacterium]|nr:diacylglycerol kinase family protein [Verrucomicrobiota bacterium]